MRTAIPVILVIGLSGAASAQVDTAWVRNLSGPTSGVHTGNAVCAMPDGGAVVTGEVIGVANMRDIVTVRYSQTGETMWTSFYNGMVSQDDAGHCVIADDSGNVYVSGSFQSAVASSNVVTIKYRPDGSEAWNQTIPWGDGGLMYDRAHAMAFDNAGDIVVMGLLSDGAWSHLLFVRKYDPNGTLIWHRTYQYGTTGGHGNLPRGLVIGANNNIYVSGAIQTLTWDYLTIRYAPNGNRVWVRIYNSTWSMDDYGTAIAVDDQGGVYVTGVSQGQAESEDYLTVKYDSIGVVQWERRYIGPANGADRPIGIGLDDAGAIYVGGLSRGFSSLDDFHIIKYDSTPLPIWSRQYTGPGFSTEIPQSFRVDPSGITYISGASGPSSATWEYATVSYDSEGYPRWERRYGAGDGTPDSATAMYLDANGNVFLTGKGNAGTASETITTVKYSPCGAPPALAVPPTTSIDSPCAGTPYSISWNPSPGATGYELYENDIYISGGADTARTIVHTDGSFYYTVRVVRSSCGKSAFSSAGGVTNVMGCGCHGDPSCDGVTNVVDVTNVINEAFRGISGTAAPTCPHVSSGDVDCDCAVTITDVVRIINVAFRGVSAATEICNACITQCP